MVKDGKIVDEDEDEEVGAGAADVQEDTAAVGDVPDQVGEAGVDPNTVV